MTQTFELKATLPSLNEIIDASKTHWAKYSSPKAEYTGVVAAYAKQKLEPVSSPVDIHVHWICKDKRTDPDNISAGIKYILDGLKAAKIIKNDNWKWINSIRHTFEKDKKNPRVVVKIKEF